MLTIAYDMLRAQNIYTTGDTLRQNEGIKKADITITTLAGPGAIQHPYFYLAIAIVSILIYIVLMPQLAATKFWVHSNKNSQPVDGAFPGGHCRTIHFKRLDPFQTKV
jgi:hypothetical protein